MLKVGDLGGISERKERRNKTEGKIHPKDWKIWKWNTMSFGICDRIPYQGKYDWDYYDFKWLNKI